MNINTLAKLVLGHPYNGPSVSYDNYKREFVVFSHTYSDEIEYSRGKTLKEAIEKALVNLEKTRNKK